MRSDIGHHPQADDIASAQLAVDCDVEQSQVALLFAELEPSFPQTCLSQAVEQKIQVFLAPIGRDGPSPRDREIGADPANFR